VGNEMKGCFGGGIAGSSHLTLTWLFSHRDSAEGAGIWTDARFFPGNLPGTHRIKITAPFFSLNAGIN